MLLAEQVLQRGHEDGDGGHIQIGRSPPLSSDKTSHFRLLQKSTGVAFDRILFFDDCGWSDNCAVCLRFPRVVHIILTGTTIQNDPPQISHSPFVARSWSGAAPVSQR